MKIWLDKSTNQTIIQTEQNTILDLLNEDITTDILEFLFDDGYTNDNKKAAKTKAENDVTTAQDSL